MKKILLIAWLCLLPSVASAQIINQGFEEWDTNSGGTLKPVGWYSSYYGAGKIESAYSGEHAISVWNWYSHALGYIITGEAELPMVDFTNMGVPIDFLPTALTGYYKYELGQNRMEGEKIDSAAVYVFVKRYNPELQNIDTISLVVALLPPSAEWIPFSIALPSMLPGVQPDSIVVSFYSSNPERVGRCGPDSSTCCYLSIDDIALERTAGVAYNLDRFLSPARILPNPVVNAAASFEFAGEEGKTYSLRIYDASGRLVVEHEVAGGTAELSSLGLPSGAYHVAVVDGLGAPVAAGRFIVE